jgi:hypothetical protein
MLLLRYKYGVTIKLENDTEGGQTARTALRLLEIGKNMASLWQNGGMRLEAPDR